jgi:hypothetical protein
LLFLECLWQWLNRKLYGWRAVMHASQARRHCLHSILNKIGSSQINIYSHALWLRNSIISIDRCMNFMIYKVVGWEKEAVHSQILLPIWFLCGTI